MGGAAAPPSGPAPRFVARAGDCDDGDADAHMYAPERCNDADDDCDGLVDEGLATARWWPDRDGDGFGDDARPADRCAAPDGYIDVPGDCDDRVAAVSPAAVETCDDRDEDCDGRIDEDTGPAWFADQDEDWYGDPDVVVHACDQPDGFVPSSDDCDDGDEDVNPGTAERCNGIDDDCDGVVDGPRCR
jgi:hypothetical protein